MAGTYVKLFGSILNSSVWCADPETRLVWITMLLLADGDGHVWGAVPGIARQAGVSLDGARRAIEILSGPDPDSRTPDQQGRRLVTIDGGWRIVNARKYREMQTNGQRKASDRSKRYRERKRDVTQRDDRDASRLSRTESEEETEEEAEPEDEHATYTSADALADPIFGDCRVLIELRKRGLEQDEAGWDRGGWRTLCPVCGENMTVAFHDEKPGSILLKCHGGYSPPTKPCANERIVAALGCGMKDLFVKVEIPF